MPRNIPLRRGLLSLVLRLVVMVCLGWPVVYAQICAPLPLLPADQTTGALDRRVCALLDGTPYAAYRLNLPARGAARITVDSGVPGINLMLQDSTGVQVASGSAIQRPLEAGIYTVIVNAPAEGAFTLNTSFAAEPGILCSSFPSLGLNQTARGYLSSTGCTAPDGTVFDAFWVTTFGAGKLTVSAASTDFTPLVTVRASDGSPASADLAAGTRYQVMVSSADTVGAYQIATVFSPAAKETCIARAAWTAPASDNGAIDVASCSALIADSGDLAYYNFYTLAVTANGTADLAVASTDFAATLTLLDSAGNTIASDTGGNGSRQSARIRTPLPPGNYIVQVFSDVIAGGAYHLDYNFTEGPAQPCTAVPLPLATIRGELGGASCRTSAGLGDLYTLTLASSGTVTLNVTSTSFAGRLAILDSKDNTIVAAQDVQQLGSTYLTALLPAGTYTVVAGATSGSGTYELTSTFAASSIPPCTYAQPLVPGVTFFQNLGVNSCTGTNGQPVDFYQFTLVEDAVISAVLISNEFDGLLSLTDRAGNVLRTDDNSRGYGDPLIVQFLPAGSYQLAARAASSTVGGAYLITLQTSAGPRPPLCAPRGPLPLGTSISGAIGYTACQYTDGSFADAYRIDLSAATAIDLRLNSTDFDAFLVLVDAKGNLVAQDDDSGGDTNARIQQKLAPGAYYLYAKPFGGYSSRGKYTLSLADSATPPATGR